MDQNLKEMADLFRENLPDIIAALGALGIAIDLTPFIKVQPVRWIMIRLGRLLNKELYDKIDDMQGELKEMQKDQADEKAKALRRSILGFATECRMGAKHDEEQFAQVYSDISDYEKVVKENDIPNELINANVRYIKEIYHECKMENKFV